MTLFAHSAQALGMASRDSLPHPVQLSIGSLVASGPAKVAGCNAVKRWTSQPSPQALGDLRPITKRPTRR
jgi:hypothetical protein